MLSFDNLNPQQLEAVRKVDGPIMILAGAGTGKTRVITTRIAYMLSVGIPAYKIVSLTFTNKAAREMKERIQHLLTQKPKGLFTGTFHSYCLKLLRTYFKEAGLDKHFSLLGTAEQIQLVAKALEEKGWHGLYKPEALLARISHAKNCLLSPEEVLTERNHPQFHDPDPATLAVVYDFYERQLKLNRVIDFDDCIFKTVNLLRNEPQILKLCHERFSHFLVDEFQDTNFAQLSILELLATKSNNICVVGDDDQSIYSWRGALTATLEKFEEIFPGTQLIKLEQNYRCTNVILNAANTVIKNNQGRKEKTLWSTSKGTAQIVLSSQIDDQAEARWIAKKCFALLGQGMQPKDIGILYRANTQSRALEMGLREFNVRYKVFGGKSFFERKEVKDFLSYLRLSFHPHERISFWRVVNTPQRGLGLKTLEKIEEKTREKDVSPFTVLRDGEIDLNHSTREAARQFVQELEAMHATPIVTIDDLVQRGESIIKVFGLENDIRVKTSHEGSRMRKLEALRKLPGWLKQLGENFVEEHGKLDVLSLLDQITLSDENHKLEENRDGNFVSLMTIHAAKGLEFPAIFVCGLEEDQLPHKNSVTSDLGIQEERRLFYVALTRAKERLFLSYARERYSTFHKQTRKPSRFLDELPASEILVEESMEAKDESPEDRKTQAISRLSNLKDKIKAGFTQEAE